MSQTHARQLESSLATFRTIKHQKKMLRIWILTLETKNNPQPTEGKERGSSYLQKNIKNIIKFFIAYEEYKIANTEEMTELEKHHFAKHHCKNQFRQVLLMDVLLLCKTGWGT